MVSIMYGLNLVINDKYETIAMKLKTALSFEIICPLFHNHDLKKKKWWKFPIVSIITNYKIKNQAQGELVYTIYVKDLQSLII